MRSPAVRLPVVSRSGVSAPSRTAGELLILIGRGLPVAAMLSLATLLWAGEREAYGARPGDPPSRGTVKIILAGGDGAAHAALIRAFRSSLGRSGIQAVVTTVRKMTPHQVAEPELATTGTVGPPGRVSVWLDLGVPRAATLYVTEGKNVFVRRFVLGRTLDPMALDLLEVVVTSAVEAVLAGRQLGVPREEFTRSLDRATSEGEGQQGPGAANGLAAEPPVAPPVSKVPASPTPSPAPLRPPVAEKPPNDDALHQAEPTVRLDPLAPEPLAASARPVPSPARVAAAAVNLSLAAHYEGALLTAARAVHGPGISVDADRDHWRLGASLTGRFPYDASGAGATVRLAPQGLRLSLARLYFFRPTVVMIAALGLGADLTRVTPVATEPAVVPAPSYWALDPALRPSLGLEKRLRKLRVGLVAGLDIDLVAPRYLVANGPPSAVAPSSRSIWDPWRWKPYAALVVGFFL